jgi:hypothetical protein
MCYLSGCGKSKNDDYEPPPAVAANTVTTAAPVTPKADPPAPKNKETEPKPSGISAFPKIGPPKTSSPFVSNLPQVPPPKEAPKESSKNPFAPPPPPDKPKESEPPPPPKDPEKPADWPTSLYGRPMSEWIKDISDSDPAIREMALRTLPGFGPNAREPATKAVLFHMQVAKERDPGVRAAAFEAVAALVRYGKDGGLDKESDTSDAIRILYTAADEGKGTRLHAVNTLAAFGPKAEVAIPFLVGQNMTEFEQAYQTRQAIATTLGAIAFNKDKGPNQKALHCLTDVLIKDKSAAVRLAAYQSIVTLGPPYLPPKAVAAGTAKPAMEVDEKAVAGYVRSIKNRLLPYKAEPGTNDRESATGLVERNPQVEIFARLALMRLDVKEHTDDNMNGIVKYLQGQPATVKIQALSALSFMGDLAARRLSEVCRVLEDEDPDVATAAVSTIVSMGKEAKPAIEFLEKLKNRGSKEGEKDPKDFPKKYYEELSKRAIDAINKAKPAGAK